MPEPQPTYEQLPPDTKERCGINDTGKPDSTVGGDAMEKDIRTVTIPRIAEHAGYPGNAINVRLDWVCPVHQTKRGEPFQTISWDGSRRLTVDGWRNDCGCIDKYNNVRKEAAENGLNDELEANSFARLLNRGHLEQ